MVVRVGLKMVMLCSMKLDDDVVICLFVFVFIGETCMKDGCA